MGHEVSDSIFTNNDFQRFDSCLREETAQLADWFRTEQFNMQSGVGGFEIEAWLVDHNGKPAPLNQVFLERLDEPLVVPELSSFNIELNIPQLPLYGTFLRQMNNNLEDLWKRCQRTATELDVKVMLIGILPTISIHDLTLEHMSCRKRFSLAYFLKSSISSSIGGGTDTLILAVH